MVFVLQTKPPFYNTTMGSKDADRLANGDGWKDSCDFTFFLTVFKSYHDNVMVIMKAVSNGTVFTIGKISASRGT